MLRRRRDEDEIPAEPAATSDGVASIIAADLTVRGDLLTKGELRVHGRVEGNIDCNTLLLAKGAEIVGDIVAKSARLCGVSMGKITAETVFVTKTARLTGDIHHASISIEHGAQVEGRLQRAGRETGAHKDPTGKEPAGKEHAAKDVVVTLPSSRLAHDPPAAS